MCGHVRWHCDTCLRARIGLPGLSGIVRFGILDLHIALARRKGPEI